MFCDVGAVSIINGRGKKLETGQWKPSCVSVGILCTCLEAPGLSYQIMSADRTRARKKREFLNNFNRVLFYSRKP